MSKKLDFSQESSASYVPFARKYRPSNFSQLMGQEVLTKVLTYSILNNRLYQGYLLTGIRGVGKTTSARIIAKTINCTNPLIEEKNISPCENCQNCISFLENKHPDIIEIDAASRTSVEDIREVIASSEYRPMLGQYKIFIIDEVHMLSKSAFNALLKVLEEPPPHVIFIFATTEVQKVPPTVMSRCQRYDLRRFTFQEILLLIQDISKKEHIICNSDALKIIAAKSEGSAREAVAMLDQVTNMRKNSEDPITSTMVNQILGAVDIITIINFVKYIIDNNPRTAIELVNQLYINSTNLEDFIQEVGNFTAYLSKAKILINYHDPLYESFSKEITDILLKTSLAKLSILWQIFSMGSSEIKASYNQLITAEMVAIKALYSHALPLLEELEGSNNINISSLVNEQITNTSFLVEEADKESQSSSEKGINEFLKYLHTQHEMEIYYLLLNNVELKNFSNNIMEIAGENLSLRLRDQINHLLFKWTGENWNVIITKQNEILTLKDQLINKVKASKDWQIIKEHFPNANILDILLKA